MFMMCTQGARRPACTCSQATFVHSIRYPVYVRIEIKIAGTACLVSRAFYLHALLLFPGSHGGDVGCAALQCLSLRRANEVRRGIVKQYASRFVFGVVWLLVSRWRNRGLGTMELGGNLATYIERQNLWSKATAMLSMKIVPWYWEHCLAFGLVVEGFVLVCRVHKEMYFLFYRVFSLRLPSIYPTPCPVVETLFL